MSAIRTAIGTALLALLVPGASSAQELSPDLARAQESMSEQDLRSVQRLLDARERENMYPTHERELLKVVGIGQEDNDFRSGTPALKNSDMSVAMVDTAEARNRLLAIYGGSRITPSPLGLLDARGGQSGSSSGASSGQGQDNSAEVDSSGEETDGSFSWAYVVPLLAVGAALFWNRSRS